MADSFRTIKTRLKLRRDLETNYDINFQPLDGEIILVDTSNNDLRIKIGDGESTFSELGYIDDDIRTMINSIVIIGYYHNNNFYVDSTYYERIVPYSHKIYIDRDTYKIYGYFDDDNMYHELINLPTATSETSGIMKLYNTTGSNTDGTMTQYSITDELNKKFTISVTEDETVTFAVNL